MYKCSNYVTRIRRSGVEWEYLRCVRYVHYGGAGELVTRPSMSFRPGCSVSPAPAILKLSTRSRDSRLQGSDRLTVPPPAFNADQGPQQQLI